MLIHAKSGKSLRALAFTATAFISGCGGVDTHIGGSGGVPLAELDLSGSAPSEMVLAGPDRLVINEGPAFNVSVTGDQKAIDLLRFGLDDNKLSVSREDGTWRDSGTATITIVTPALEAVVLAGSGIVEADQLRGDAEVTIAGSGTAKIDGIDAASLEVAIAGSGDLEASGRADTLDLTVAGSGTASMAGLQVENADVSVMGSGDAGFASNGKVDASIMGSGTVTVTGSATCTVSSMGSGELNCRTVNERPDGETERPAD